MIWIPEYNCQLSYPFCLPEDNYVQGSQEKYNKCQNEKQEHKVDTAESVCKLRTNDNQNPRWEKIIKISAKISEIEILKKNQKSGLTEIYTTSFAQVLLVTVY